MISLHARTSIVYLAVWLIVSAAAYGSEPQPVLKGSRKLLRLGEVRYVRSAPNDNFTLKISIWTKQGARIDHNRVTVRVLFYDNIEGKMVDITDADTSHRWMTTSKHWMKENPQVLAAHHSRPEKRVHNYGSRRHLGYIVIVWYEDALQDVVSHPKKLLPLVMRPHGSLLQRRAPR